MNVLWRYACSILLFFWWTVLLDVSILCWLGRFCRSSLTCLLLFLRGLVTSLLRIPPSCPGLWRFLGGFCLTSLCSLLSSRRANAISSLLLMNVRQIRVRCCSRLDWRSCSETSWHLCFQCWVKLVLRTWLSGGFLKLETR